MEKIVTQEKGFEEEQLEAAKIDFKMITFSLSGKDYGIDIMKVAEILKASRFTFVPNTSPYVRGVHNLRGEIIPIIDLRKLFNIPVAAERAAEGTEEDVIILRLEGDLILGIIVDSIDKVLGIASETIQPPHPIFGDINIRYIDGIVESDSRLYIILDGQKIFGEADTLSMGKPLEAERPELPVEEPGEAPGELPEADEEAGKGLTFNFVTDTLKTFSTFHVTGINRDWTESRFQEWEKQRNAAGLEVQLQGAADAEEFLKDFSSPYSGVLWGEDYKESLLKLLPDEVSGTVNIWNPGCGEGFESYSIACIAKLKYPDKRIKVWANDSDLLKISTAPNLILTKEEIPPYFLEGGFVKEQPKGFTFINAIKDCVVFEYHDILHRSEYPESQIIVARDILSYFDASTQKMLIKGFWANLKLDGLILVGRNEVLPEDRWYLLEEGNLVAYRKVMDTIEDGG